MARKKATSDRTDPAEDTLPVDVLPTDDVPTRELETLPVDEEELPLDDYGLMGQTAAGDGVHSIGEITEEEGQPSEPDPPSAGAKAQNTVDATQNEEGPAYSDVGAAMASNVLMTPGDPSDGPDPATQAILAMEPHPYSEWMPPMTEDDYEALYASIDEKGLLVPIVVFEGKILDGRHRRNVIEDLWEKKGKVVPITWREFDPEKEGGALRFVMNIHTRRNLTTGQKAAIGMRYMDSILMETETAKEIVKLRRSKDGKEQLRDIAGTMAGCGGRSIDAIRTIRAHSKATGDDLYEQVLAGEKALHSALLEAQKVARRTKEESDHNASQKEGKQPDALLSGWQTIHTRVLHTDERPIDVECWITEEPHDLLGKIAYKIIAVASRLIQDVFGEKEEVDRKEWTVEGSKHSAILECIAWYHEVNSQRDEPAEESHDA